MKKINTINLENYLKNYPDQNGMFGEFGGIYLDTELKTAMKEMDDA